MDNFDAITVSWLRCYPTSLDPMSVLSRRREAPPPLLLAGSGWEYCDDTFYDIQTQRRPHVARCRMTGVRIVSDAAPPNGAVDEVPAAVHAIVHSTGLMVLRITLQAGRRRPDMMGSLAGLDFLHACMWAGKTLDWKISTSGEWRSLRGDVRHVMDYMFFDAHESTMGRRASREDLDRWCLDYDARYDHLERLVARREIYTAFPVSFGTHYELRATVEADVTSARACVQELAGQQSCRHDSGHLWCFGENRSALLVDADRRTGAIDALEPARMQLLEYLTLRRAALRVTQRATQRAITERTTVTKPQVSGWERMITALTDDYVLHDDVGVLLGPVKAALHDQPEQRDPAELERQVRANIKSFQLQLQAANDRAGVILGVLFGVVAASAIAPIVRQIWILLVHPDRRITSLQSNDLTTGTVIDLLTVLIMLLGAIVMYRLVIRVRSPAPPGRRPRGRAWQRK